MVVPAGLSWAEGANPNPQAQQQGAPAQGIDQMIQARLDQLIEQRIDAILERKVDQYVQQSIAKHVDKMMRQGGHTSEAIQQNDSGQTPQPANAQPSKEEKVPSLAERIKQAREEQRPQPLAAGAQHNDPQDQHQGKSATEAELDQRTQELIAEFKAVQEQREAARKAQPAQPHAQQQPEPQSDEAKNLDKMKKMQEALEQHQRQQQAKEQPDSPENQHQGAADEYSAAQGNVPPQQ
jgi:hypothetical protein